jgi:hypothetical protein
MSWAEAYPDRYDEWSAPVTADIPFYVELAVGNGRVAIPIA